MTRTDSPITGKSLEARDLSCGYKGKPILEHANLSIERGEVVCLLGPNGVGKTTLFKTLLGFLPPLAGDVLVDGVPRAQLSRKQFARAVSYVPQTHTPPFSFSVIDMVLTGCVSHLGMFDSPRKADYDRAEAVLEKLGISHLSERAYTEISGGEAQMTLIARSLMQDAGILMMDEPTAALDFGNQISVLARIKELAGAGHGVVMTTHNPDHAFLCATKAALIDRRGHIECGPVDAVVTEENLGHAYGITVKIAHTEDERGRPIKTCVPRLD